MATLTILQGPPASGKSTIARELHLKSPKDTVIVCKDSLRIGRGTYWIPSQEGYIAKLEYEAVRLALDEGLNVIVDGTNLNPTILRQWKWLASKYQAEIKYIKVDTPLDECLKRNSNPDRGHKVPDDVIKSFFKKYKLCTTTN